MANHIFQLIRRSETSVDSIESSFGEWLGSSFPSNVQIEEGRFWANIRSGKVPKQDVIGSFSNDLIVSSRMRDLLWAHSVPEFVKCIPVEIRGKHGKVLGNYYVIHEYNKWVDVANEQLSVPKYAGKVLVRYAVLVIDEKKVPSWDLIPILPCQWLVSAKMKDILVRFNYTGFSFSDHSMWIAPSSLQN